MIKDFIKTAFRTLLKNKGFTAINVLGLALGLATCMLIVFYVIDELSYDKFNTKTDRIYRVNSDIKFGGSEGSFAVTPAPLAVAFLSELPEVKQVARFRSWGGFQVKKGNQNLREHKVVYADASIFDIFTFPMIAGDPKTALKDPRTVVINESTAKKYFNTTNVIGKTLTLNDSLLYKVTGVIKDIPKQAHFNYDFFLSMQSLPESKENSWVSNNFNTYILLKKGASQKSMEAKLPKIVRAHVGPQLQAVIHKSLDDVEKGGDYIRLNLTPLNDIHLHSNRVAELNNNGNIQYVYIFSAIALFILLIACVNFMNLSTARSSNRAREVGVRKVLGSPRKFLIAQFLSESILVTFVATVIAVLAAWVLLPLFNQMSGKELMFTPGTFVWLAPVLIALVVVIGCLAGSYPALFLSAFQPIDVLKGKLSSGFKAGWLRNFLVVFQFSISIFLIVGTLVIYNQLKYIQHKDLGYKRNQVLIVHNVYAIGKQTKIFKQEIEKFPNVVSATLTGFLPTEGNGNSTTFFQDHTMDSKKALSTQLWSVDEKYIPTLGMKMISGRNFSKDMSTDSAAVIINETAAKKLAMADVLNKVLYYPADRYGKVIKPVHIIGVVKDFNFNSLRENITPVILTYGDDWGAVGIKIKTANVAALIDQIKDKWKALAPGQQFDYSFMDADFDAAYRTEQRMGTIFITFTTLAIIIACLGLFGLAAYAAEQRVKEIGIRKVLGANVSKIVAMLSYDFIKLVLISIVIASPIAWWAMQKWLQDFAYRQNIQWWVFALAGIGAVVIAFVTISFQSIKAALSNPVNSLRSE
ncbi:MAG: FtsX-like permease family protein [Mucilaginibacter sp.]|nr:FtsX-like permease family protein [Mucilaginibacter sp.]